MRLEIESIINHTLC